MYFQQCPLLSLCPQSLGNKRQQPFIACLSLSFLKENKRYLFNLIAQILKIIIKKYIYIYLRCFEKHIRQHNLGYFIS